MRDHHRPVEARLAEQLGELVGAEELERTKAYLSGSFVLDRRTNGRQSFYLAFYEVMGVGAEYVLHYPGLLEAVDANEVLRAGRHKVRVVLNDGREAVQTVDVDAGRWTRVRLEL